MPRTAFNSKGLVSDINRIVEGEIGKYLTEVQIIMRKAYEKIVYDSPVITAYYQTNHTITIRGRGGQFKTQGARLSPGIKDTEEPLAYIGNLDSRMAEERQKLVLFAIGDTIEIGTTVPYADDVERNHNVYGSTAATFELEYKS